jgi:hypothetical protein
MPNSGKIGWGGGWGRGCGGGVGGGRMEGSPGIRFAIPQRRVLLSSWHLPSCKCKYYTPQNISNVPINPPVKKLTVKGAKRLIYIFIIFYTLLYYYITAFLQLIIVKVALLLYINVT